MTRASGVSVELMCTVIDVPVDGVTRKRTFEAVMNIIKENPNLKYKTVSMYNYILSRPMTEEELKAQEKMKKQCEDLEQNQDLGHSC